MQQSTNITSLFEPLYHPVKALVIYQQEGQGTGTYVESFDFGKDGRLRNAHPLSVREASLLADCLTMNKDWRPDYLRPDGLLPDNLLHIGEQQGGRVIWFTRSAYRHLHFSDSLDIPSGRAAVPALLWVATPERLHLYALASDQRPDNHTSLYHAPFFNLYPDGAVCMGSVNVQAAKAPSLPAFMAEWEAYFFGSYFTQLLRRQTVKENPVTLWKHLRTTGESFPGEQLLPNGQTIQNIIL